jgi:hypothetical protein
LGIQKHHTWESIQKIYPFKTNILLNLSCISYRQVLNGLPV